MQFTARFTVTTLVMCLAVPVYGTGIASTQLQLTIAQAISRYEETPREKWAFQMSSYENEEGDISSSVVSFDPARNKQQPWQLLSIDGKIPTAKQQRTFAKRHNKNDGQEKVPQKEQQSFRFKLRDLIVLDSLTLLSEDENLLRAKFAVELQKLGVEASKKLTGELLYNKRQKFIEQVVIRNTAPFSPMFSAKITQFSLTFEFDIIHNAVLPQKYHLNMQGSFAFFTEINEVSSNTFSDYRLLEL